MPDFACPVNAAKHITILDDSNKNGKLIAALIIWMHARYTNRVLLRINWTCDRQGVPRVGLG